MLIISHITYPALTYIILTRVTALPYATPVLSALIVASCLPDVDVLYQKAVLKKPFDQTFQHHRWLSHWPITYLPLVLLTASTHNYYVFVATLGVYSHLLLDTIFVADGIMWLYPFSKKMYCYFGNRTNGHHGKEWLKIYSSLPIFKLDILSFIALIMVLLLPFTITK